MSVSPTILSKAQTSYFRSLKQAKFRKQTGLFLMEGLRLCEEAFTSTLNIRCVIMEKDVDKLAIPDGITVFSATKTQIEQISHSRSPQGIIVIAEIPPCSPVPSPRAGERLLALDRISDPGNMGTIFRSALWFGVKHILLSPECVDPYSPKVVRSSMGAIGHLSIHQSQNLLDDCQSWRAAEGNLAALHMTGEPLKHHPEDRGLCLIVGSEAHGVAAELLSISTLLSIPKVGQGESLNAAMATSIALYELNKH